MIQTQLLRAEKPYQIICAAGMVGIQVATLIVIEERDGRYDTHSHPVVNYGNKEGLEEELKYNRSGMDVDDDYRYTIRLQPEGAVWNRVEVRDVSVLGLVGAHNVPISLERFVGLVPRSPSNAPALSYVLDPLWGLTSASDIRNMLWAMERVGIKHERGADIGTAPMYDGDIHLSIDRTCKEPTVRVQIRSIDVYDPRITPISFMVRITEDNKEWILTITNCLLALINNFSEYTHNTRVVHDSTSSPWDELDKQLKQATKHINSVISPKGHNDI